ncbi:MAG: molybdopterin oxidoreductase family protein [Armatimonadetes bacterium]|nr:molybdopterin oxidoreductase family protein [Armatimonadota bacterium]MDE2205306.1 molybdopterin oxidoreductase family protein [Armatimonadota bacterium]
MTAPVKTVLTACPHDCPDGCSMLATVALGGEPRLLSVAGNPANPYTRGTLCRKVAHYEDRVYSPDRVLTPMRRIGGRGEGNFARIGWDEAIGEIAARWKQIIAESGPEAILPYSYGGTMGLVNMTACDARLWNRMGASQLKRTICSSGAEAGYGYVYGSNEGIDPESFAQSRFIIAWGTNLSSTNVHMMPIIREAQRNGATLVVIDPFRTRTASAADWFVQPKPGTDAALALGMANVIFAAGLHDERWLELHSVGWRKFRERCAMFPLERTAAITGLPATEIETLALRYAREQPSAIRLGYGIARNSNGGSMVRAIVTLPAVIGAWDRRSAGLLLSTSRHFPLNMRSVKRPDLLHSPDDESPVKWGRSVPRAINMIRLGAALLEERDPPIRSVYVYNSNPAAVAPNSNRVREGLEREDLFTVVHEQMMTDTARYADILLPATTQMEHLDLIAPYGHLYLNLSQPAIPARGEARPNIEVLNALAGAMGYTDAVFQESAEEIIRGALQSSEPLMNGVTWERLLEHGFARLNTPTAPWAPWLGGKPFKTASGKAELWSQRAADDGLDPLPDYTPPTDEGVESGMGRYPINLLSPAAHHFLNSSFSNQSELQKAEKEPRIWISHADAAARSVSDGDMLRVWNRRGEVLLRAVVSAAVKPGVAWSPSMWWRRDSPNGSGINSLTSDMVSDMGESSTFHTNLVQFARSET